MLTVLQAVLVDGYGSGADLKESLGWESNYNPTGDRAVFRPTDVGSNRLYLYVDGKSHPWGANYNYMRGYIVFNGWTGDDIDAEGQFGASNTARAYTTALGNRDWMIIGTSRSFYMWISHYVSGMAGDFGASLFSVPETDAFGWRRASDFFFGDLAPKSTGFNTHIADQTGTNNSLSFNTYLNYRATGHIGDLNSNVGRGRCAATPDGFTTNVVTRRSVSMTLNSSGSTSGIHVGGNNMSVYPPIDGNFAMERIKVTGNPYFYGYLPGVWAPYHDISLQAVDRPFDYLDILQLGGVDHMVVPFGGAAGANTSANIGRSAFLVETNAPWHDA